MRRFVKPLIRNTLRKFGYDIWRYDPQAEGIDRLGVQLFRDLQLLLAATPHPLLLDVGANVGQTVRAYKDLFPQSTIHAFEPSPEAFETLRRATHTYTGVVLNNLGVGSAAGTAKFLEYKDSQWSSFLEPGEDNPGAVEREISVDVTTLDCYCEEHNVEFVHLLKTDTQGFDFEVLQGARTFLSSNRVQFVLTEVNFADHYKNSVSFDKLFRFLLEDGFKLVALYNFHYYGNYLSWCDALFKNPSFRESRS